MRYSRTMCDSIMRIDILLITKGRAYCANHDKYAEGKYSDLSALV